MFKKNKNEIFASINQMFQRSLEIINYFSCKTENNCAFMFEKKRYKICNWMNKHKTGENKLNSKCKIV